MGHEFSPPIQGNSKKVILFKQQVLIYMFACCNRLGDMNIID